MKKFGIIALIAILILALAACGRKNKTEETDPTGDVATMPSLLDPTIMDPTLDTNIPDAEVDTRMPE